MKSTIHYVLSILCAAAGMASCSHAHDTNADKHAEESHNQGEIILEPNDAERFGVTAETVTMMDLSDVIRVSGRIVASSSDEATIVAAGQGVVHMTAGINIGSTVSAGTKIASISADAVSGGNPNAVARAAVSAAKKEVDRLKPLLDERIVTRREYDAAVAAYESALAAYSPAASSGAAVSPINGVITSIAVKTGDYVNAGSPIATVSRNSTLLLRADLPEKYRGSTSRISGANFRTSYSDRWLSIDSLGGRKDTTPASGVTAEAGYIPVYFSIANDGSMAAGDYAEVCLLMNSGDRAIALPDEAIVEQQGNYFVYVRTGDHSYEKRKIEKGESDGTHTRVINGLNEGETVVTRGASIVRLAETSKAVPEGHTHNH